MADDFATSKDLNGLGSRVSDLKEEIGRHDERIGRNREDVKIALGLVDGVRGEIKKAEDKIQGVELTVKERISELESIFLKETTELKISFHEETSKLAIKIGSIAGGISVAGIIALAVFQYLVKAG